MTLSQAIKKRLYALFIYREPEPFSYVRDTDEITESTHFKIIFRHSCPYYIDDCPRCVKRTNHKDLTDSEIV